MRTLFWILGVPLMLAVATFTCSRVEESIARRDLVRPEALDWVEPTGEFRVTLARTVDGEVERFTIAIHEPGHTEPRRIPFEIDHDLFGGGFVGGLDVDGDGDRELVLATRAGRAASRVVDVRDGVVVVQSFAELPLRQWAPIARRLDRIIKPYALSFAIATLLWVVIGIPLRLCFIAGRWLWRRRGRPAGT